MMGLFSIPEGQRGEMGRLIDHYADRLLKTGELTQEDRDALFDRLYDEGVMTIPADTYFASGREAVQGGRIYVRPELRADFGDDWNTIRRRAFAAGVYLTSNMNDPGVDVWNMQLAEQFPGIFDPQSTDEYSMLEHIVQLAEEGADEKMGLAEYARMLAGQEGISESEILDNMERQVDWALRTFAEKADLEIKLRDRTGYKMAQERAKRQESARKAKENLPTNETVTVFTPAKIEAFRDEASRTWGNGERIYQQAAAYTLMLNTGLRTGEALGLLNSDIDLENKVIHLQRGVKEVSRRDGTEATSGREVNVGKLKSASSKRDVPLNKAAIDAILDLRAERYFGEDKPLISDEQGDFTRPVNFRKRYYRILEAAGLERKGLHSLRHTFATTLVNGVKQEDGTIKSLSPRQVADLLGHSTSEITEMYYVKKDTSRLAGITMGFKL